jgi:antitoxin (DNA-binding transcriptional repressor) of toxin-antitoxin stability system
MATRIAAASARRQFATLLRLCARGERIELTRYGKTIAMLVPPADLHRKRAAAINRRTKS